MDTVEEKSFCIQSVHREVVDPEISFTENFSFAEALESVYPILDIIFEYLDCNNLRNCCNVSKNWKDVAERILNKRIEPSWFTCFKGGVNNKSNIFEHSDNLNFNNAALGIILYDFRRIKLNKYICVHTDVKKLTRKTVPEYFEAELVPHNTDYCVISCAKVISNFGKNTKNLCQASYFDGLFFPKIPNIRMVMFHCCPSKKSTLPAAIDSYINSNEQVKCLLMFSTTDQKKALYNLLKLLVPESETSSVALGGGIIRGTKTFQRVNPSKRMYSYADIFSIVFLKQRDQEANFNAFSYVIYGDDLSKDEFTEEVVKFKSNIFLRTHSIAVRICCSAKVDADEEPLIFSKIFPGIPIFGCHADGEIGWNCVLSSEKKIDDETESQAKKSKHTYPNVRHQWSTVFVLMTWGSVL